MEAENIYPSAPIYEEIDTSNYSAHPIELEPFRPSYEDIILEYQNDINDVQRSVTFHQEEFTDFTKDQNIISIRYIDDKWRLEMLEMAKTKEIQQFETTISNVHKNSLAITTPIFSAITGISQMTGVGICLLGEAIGYEVPIIGGLVRIIGGSIYYLSPCAGLIVSLPLHVALCGMIGGAVATNHAYNRIKFNLIEAAIHERLALCHTMDTNCQALPPTTTMIVTLCDTEQTWKRNWMTLGLLHYQTRLYICNVKKMANTVGEHTYLVKKRYNDFYNLHYNLVADHPRVALPNLPPTSWWHTEQVFLEREAAFRKYVEFLSSPELVNDPNVIEFFMEE